MEGSLMQVQSLRRAPDRVRIDRVWRGLRRLAWLGAAMTFAVLVLAAAMRFQNAAVGCDPWPACRELAGSAADTPVWVRMTHRIVATLVALCALAITVVAFRRAPHCRLPRVRAALALAGVAGLAVLGRASGAGAPPLVLLSNLLGGLALLAVFVSIALSRPYGDVGPVRGRAMVDVVLVVLAITSGGVASTFSLSTACGDAWLCAPWASTGDGGAWGVLLHRMLGVVLLVRVVGAQLRAGRGAGAALAVGVLAQLAAGVWQSVAGTPFTAALVHHALSALVLVAAMWVATTDRAGITQEGEA